MKKYERAFVPFVTVTHLKGKVSIERLHIMPRSAKKPCKFPWCKALIDSGGYCAEHAKELNRDHGSAGVRRTGRKGVKDRDRIKRRDNGLCQHCLNEGRLTIGTQVDHIVPLAFGGSDTDDNKQLLCDACHKAKSRLELRKGRGGSNV